VGGVTGSKQVALWGDSITFDATPALRSSFESAYATASWSFGGIVISQAFDEAISQIQFDPPDAFVIQLGGNNTRDGDIDDADRAEMRRLADIVRPSGCVVWVNASTSRPDLLPLVAQLDAALAALPADRPWVKIADWNAVAISHPEWFRPDGVHYNPTGNAAYASWLRGEVERLCGIRPV
jgi:lysophospholipase L1-like esterase